jgi:hypothetical protein
MITGTHTVLYSAHAEAVDIPCAVVLHLLH